MNFKKMVWLRLVLISCLVLTQVGLAQIRVADGFQHDTDLRVEFNLPDNAVIGSTPERKAAWDALSEEEREELVKLVGPYLADALRKSKESYEKNEWGSIIKPPSQINFVKWDGVSERIPTKNSLSQEVIQEFGNSWAVNESLDNWSANAVSVQSVPVGNMPVNMPTNFSETLADLFTPYYRISYGETDQFATFQNNQTSLLVDQLKGQNPLSYYRVHPMGFATQNGTKYGFFKIDYLTLWNHDSGLAINPYAYLNMWLDFFFCYDPPLAYVILAAIDAADRGHNYDPERSAVLVGAPVVSNNYNPNPNAYYIYSVYAAAHEGTQSNQSTYSSPASPVQGHVELFLALRKHATYFGNPNGLPLTPAWIIDTCYLTAQSLYLQGVISFSQYSTLAYYFDLTFFNAITERFLTGGNQGFAYPRINVGEPVIGQILNNCGFIMTTGEYGVKGKLLTPLWTGFN